MPFVSISLARGKPPEYLEAVSRAVHGALAAELSLKPGELFQVIDQRDEQAISPGGPRSQDWIAVTITDSADRGERAKRRFYKTLVRLLGESPGVRPADVFVMLTVTPPENFSYADGVMAADAAAAEALDAAATVPGTRDAYTGAELADAVTELFRRRDSRPIRPMLRGDVILKVPATLPYGGEFTGPEAFDGFFAGTPGGSDVWESFTVHLDDVIESGDHLIARLTNTATPKATGRPVVFQNLWLFEVTDGKIARAQLYADTAAVQPAAA